MPLIGGRYYLGEKIGSGSFGKVYLALDTEKGEEVAVKVESALARKMSLERENKVYKVLGRNSGTPQARWFGQEGSNNVLVMDLLGPSLEQLFKLCSQRFTMKTVLMLGIQMIERIESVHHRLLVHRDIKPANFLMGIGKQRNKVFLADYGLAKSYRRGFSHMFEHIPYRVNKPLIGTAVFASTNNHLGIEQTRKDDMESLGYVLVYFLKGSLPWQGLGGETKKQKYEKMSEKKMSTHTKVLCEDLPIEFEIYFRHCWVLSFCEAPDYKPLMSMFYELFRCHKYQFDNIYDWVLQKQDSVNPGVYSTAEATAGTSCSPTTGVEEKCSKCAGDHWTLQCPFKDENDRQLWVGKSGFRKKPEVIDKKRQELEIILAAFRVVLNKP